MDDFNPYQVWLGMAAEDLSPDHYRLLSLEPLDDDAERIARAADATIARVRGVRPGDHALRWKDLLDELDAAKRCLLDPQQKSQYDKQLRGEVPAESIAPADGSRGAAIGSTPLPHSVDSRWPPGMEPSGFAPSAQSPQPIASPPAAPAPIGGQPSPDNPSIPSAPSSSPLGYSAPAPGVPSYSPPPTAVPPNPQANFNPPNYQQPNYPAPPGQFVQQVAPTMNPGFAPPSSVPTSSGPPSPPPPIQEETPGFDLRASSRPRSQREAFVGPTFGPSAEFDGQAASSRGRGVTRDKLAGTSQAGGESQFGTSSDFSTPTSLSTRRRSKSMLPYALAGSALLLLASIVTSLLVSPDSTDLAMADTPGEQMVPNHPAAAVPATENANLPDSANSANGEAGGQAADAIVPREGIAPLPTIDNPPPGVTVGTTPDTAVGVVPAETVDLPPDRVRVEPDPTTTGDPPMTQVKPTDNPPADDASFPPPETNVDPADPVPAAEPPPETPSARTASPQQAAVVDRALAAAMKAMSLRRYDEADSQLKIAASAAVDEELKKKVERVNFIQHGVKIYWEAIRDGLKDLKGTDEVQIGNTIAIVVDATPERLVLRVAGRQKEYSIDGLPLGLAREFADRWFKPNEPSTKVYTGAFLLVEPNGDREEVRRLWEEAKQGGADIDYLMPLLDESFESTAVERSPMPSAAEVRAVQETLGAEFRRALQGAATPAAKSDLARRWMSDADDSDSEPSVRYFTLQAALHAAATAPDATLLVQAADMLGDFFEIDRYDLKASALRKAASASQDPTKNGEVALALLELADEAQARSDQQAEKSLLDLAAASAAKAQDADLVRQVDQRRAGQ